MQKKKIYQKGILPCQGKEWHFTPFFFLNERHNRQKNKYFVMKNMVARNYDNFMKRKKIKHL